MYIYAPKHTCMNTVTFLLIHIRFGKFTPTFSEGDKSFDCRRTPHLHPLYSITNISLFIIYLLKKIRNNITLSDYTNKKLKVYFLV